MSLVLSSGMHVTAARPTTTIVRPRMSTTVFVGEFPASFGKEPRVVTRWTDVAPSWSHARASPPLDAALEGFFANGGTTAVCVPIAAEEAWSRDRVQRFADALQVSQAFDEVGLVCAPGETDPAIQDLLLDHCEMMRDRFAILDGPAELKVGAVQGVARPRESPWGACYFPWLLCSDVEGGVRTVPPSGHVAGVFARVESERGVGRAPENELVRRVTDVRYPLSRSEQDVLESVGINVIRHLGVRGIRVLGERTMANESAWSSISNRRLSLMIVRAIHIAGQASVFANEDDASALQRSLSAFLARLQSEGTIAGRTAAEGFSVSCSIDASLDHRMVCRVDVAPEKPGEFVSFSAVVPVSGWNSSSTNETGHTEVLPAS